MSDVEKIAEIIYQAMRWAIKHPHVTGDTPPWVPNGNSQAQDRAREAARAALSAARPDEWNAAIEAAEGVVEDSVIDVALRLAMLRRMRALRRPAGEEG